jgi:hypothetical protein
MHSLLICSAPYVRNGDSRAPLCRLEMHVSAWPPHNS